MPLDKDDITAIAQDEEVRWIRTYTAVERELKRTEADYKGDRTLARELTSQLVATRRDEEKMLLLNEERVSHSLTELRKNKALSLDSLLDQPYFARVVCEEGARTFEFRLGTASFPEERIVDWRESPLAAIYYNHQEGDAYSEEINNRDREGVVTLRRSFRGKHQLLEAIELPTQVLTRHTSPAGDTQWVASDKAALTAPIRITADSPRGNTPSSTTAAYSRTDTQSGHLPQILSLLTPEQYSLITSPTDQPMVIQGGAGSGKTTVALHRLAWLLHAKNSDARPRHCLVVMLNRSLRSYVQYTLPELGVEAVRIETFNQWAEKILRHSLGDRHYLNLGRDADILAFKALPEVLDLLTPFVRGQTRRMLELVTRDLPRLDKLSRAFWETDVETPARAATPILAVLHDATAKAKRQQRAAPLIALLEQVSRRMSLFTADLHLLWQDDALLEAIRLAHYATDPVMWKKVKESLRLEVSSKQLDAYDDPLLLHLIFLKWGYYPTASGEAETLDHLVVDEAQDFSVAELSALTNALRAPHDLTLVGDLAQKIILNKSFGSWDDILKRLGFTDTAPLHLTVAYRSTIPIMQLAAAIRQEVANEGALYAANRMGPVPRYLHTETRRDMLLAIKAWIVARTQEAPRSLSGIICRSIDEAVSLVNELRTLGLPNVRLGNRDAFDFSPGVLITDVQQVKGLEFRHVLIVNPSDRAYAPAHPESRNLLYVAITRAEAHLDFIGDAPPTPLLPPWVFEEDDAEDELPAAFDQEDAPEQT